jgi:hypothetical protein
VTRNGGATVARSYGSLRRGAFVAAISIIGCKAPAPSDTIAPASPQASAEPTPLATPLMSPSSTLISSFAGADAAPPPVPLRGDRAMPPDVISPMHEAVASLTPSPTGKESVGYTLQAVLHAGDVAPHARFPETNAAGVEAARKRLEQRLVIDMLANRMRMAMSGAFVLPANTEIRARSDLFGYAVVAPDASSYRVAAPGALRSVFGERRFDVAPLLPAELAPRGDAPMRFGLRTRRVDVMTRAAKASFEVAHADGVGEGGVLLCRVLLDLMNAPPTTPLCAFDEIPLQATLRWNARGSLSFEGIAFTRRSDLAPQQLATPPLTAAFTDAPLPALRADVLLFESELSTLRSGVFETPEPTVPRPTEVGGALLFINATDQLRIAWLDGLPVAWLAPGMRLRVAGLQRGRYTLQWRTFLGEMYEAPQPITVPGIAQLGGSDAGVAP